MTRVQVAVAAGLFATGIALSGWSEVAGVLVMATAFIVILIGAAGDNQ